MRGDRNSIEVVQHNPDTFSCRALSMDGGFQRMLMPLKVETDRRAGTAGDKMNEVLVDMQASTAFKEFGFEHVQNAFKGFRQFLNPELELTVRFGSAPEPEP